MLKRVMPKKVMIISGESSGELYGAYLAKALKTRNPEIDIAGVGGERMQAAGVRLVSKISSSFGVVEAIRTYSEIKKTFGKILDALKSSPPDALVLIDYPDFNMRLAKEAKKLGIKILYYVSPQIWAWRKGRIKTIGRLIDKMAVILPFEEEIYKRHDIPCEFVGHPILDEIREILRDTADNESKLKIKKELGLIPERPAIALMPGSRFHEIKKLLPEMSAVIKEMKEKNADCQFVMPVAPNLSGSALSLINEFKETHNNELHIANNSIKALISADAAVIASGTSALQAAFLGIPTVVVYKLSPLTYFLGRLIVKVRHISLPNILLDKSVKDDSGLRIKELLQTDANAENIAKELIGIMDIAEYRNEMTEQLRKVRGLFLYKNASLRAAEMAEELTR
jgi:lipid-A-disaccharide synthase